MEEEQVTIPHHTLESHTIAIQLRIVTCTNMVMSTPAIAPMSARLNVNAINALDTDSTGSPEIKAIESPFAKQPLPEAPTYDTLPVEQQHVLYNFFHYVDQGTSNIPCGGKIYHPSLNMDPVAWPHEKSACLPRTLAQLAHQDFKKEPLDNFAIMLSSLYLVIPCSL